MKKRTPSGFSITELLVVIASITLLAAMTLPVIAGARGLARTDVSLSNLVTLGAAHAVYAADHDGRQLTQTPDDISSYGSDAHTAAQGYASAHNGEYPPALILGWGAIDQNPAHYALLAYRQNFSGNRGLPQPIVFEGQSNWIYFGSFRLFNTRALHNYMSGRFYDPVLYPPSDAVVYEIVEPALASPDEYYDSPPLPGVGDIPYWSSYCMSPAAMFHPDVMRHPLDGGWQSPWLLDHGFQSPGLYQATYPDLKTQFIEHHWIQNALPDPCNPAFSGGVYGPCEPYYFNMAVASEPATLFYDMSARLLPNTEVIAADDLLIQQTGYGLWSRDTPLGNDGYLGQFGYDLFDLSHHILTTDGIHGRDTLGPGMRGSDRATARRKRPSIDSPLASPFFGGLEHGELIRDLP
jgi:hypothetical protein